MDFLSSDPRECHNRYLFLKERYKQNKITITTITTTKKLEETSENLLEHFVGLAALA